MFLKYNSLITGQVQLAESILGLDDAYALSQVKPKAGMWQLRVTADTKHRYCNAIKHNNNDIFLCNFQQF